MPLKYVFKYEGKSATWLILNQLAQNSVYASLGTSIGFTLLLAIGFSLLRPYNSVVYAPKLKVADDKHAPPPMGKGVFAWVGPVLKTTEQELVQQIGLDAVVFLRVLRMCRNIFVILAIVGCGILIPINLSKGQKFSTTNTITEVTPVNVYGSANWGMTICAWIFDIVLAGFLWWNYRVILRLRRQYYDSPEYYASLHARTLMVGFNIAGPASFHLPRLDQRYSQRFQIGRRNWKIDR